MPAQSQGRTLAAERSGGWANSSRPVPNFGSQQTPSYHVPDSGVKTVVWQDPALGQTAAAVEEPTLIPTFAHLPYFTAIQLETLYARQRGQRMSVSTWQTNRDIATGFIQSVASRLGFPQRTTATAQQIYQRFHLFYPPSDFVLHETAVASLFVAAKLNDTHKKPRDILLASYALRYPQYVRGGSSDVPVPSSSKDALNTDELTFPTLAGQKRKHAIAATSETSVSRPLAMPIGSVAESDIDPNVLEGERKRLLSLEKLILESLCFNFHSSAHTALKMVIKLGRKSNMPKSFIRTAWKVAADMFRTSVPMQYPPNVIAAAALYAAALLARPPSRPTSTNSEERPKDAPPSDDADPMQAFLASIRAASASATPTTTDADAAVPVPLSEMAPQCDASLHVNVEDVEESVHELLDLYLACAAQLPPSLYMASAQGAGVGGSAAATPSPLSPADHVDVYNASPSSSAGLSDPAPQPANARRKLKQYEYSPPPFGLVEWLNSSRCSQLQGQVDKGLARKNASADPTLPTKEFSALLTDLKIYLRGIEYDRQRADDAFLADLGIVAQINVLPQQGAAGMEAATPSGAVGAAQSVAIELQPMTGARADALASLDKERMQVVKRIQRRKLVSALRVTFVEPGIEKRPPPHSQRPPLANATTPADATSVKRRIENAKRYLF